MNGPQQRQRDEPKLLPAPRALDGRGVVEVFGHGRKAAEKNRHGEGDRHENADQDLHRKRGGGLRQPLDVVAEDTEVAQAGIEHAALAVERPAPDDRRHGQRDRPGQHDQHARDAAAVKVLVEDQRDRRRDDQRAEDDRDGPEQRAPERVEEIGIGEEFLEIGEADEGPHHAEAIDVMRSQRDDFPDRPEDDRRGEEEARQDQEIRGRAADHPGGLVFSLRAGKRRRPKGAAPRR